MKKSTTLIALEDEVKKYKQAIAWHRRAGDTDKIIMLQYKVSAAKRMLSLYVQNTPLAEQYTLENDG